MIYFWGILFFAVMVVFAVKQGQALERGNKAVSGKKEKCRAAVPSDVKTFVPTAAAPIAPVASPAMPAPERFASAFAPEIPEAKTETLVTDISQVDELEGRAFERFLKVVFEQKGYKADLTPFYDWGADLVLEKNGKKTVVQAKRWKCRVAQNAVQEVVAAKAKYNAQNAMVVTNNFYYGQAQELGRLNQVEMWNRNTLIEHLRHFSVLVPPAESANGAVCALCGKSVTNAVVDYCNTNAHKFGDQILCFEHQPRMRRRTSSSACVRAAR